VVLSPLPAHGLCGTLSNLCSSAAVPSPATNARACCTQDVGLVFLSGMATSIAAAAAADGQTAEQVLGTALVTLSIATALVGVVAYLVGA